MNNATCLRFLAAAALSLTAFAAHAAPASAFGNSIAEQGRQALDAIGDDMQRNLSRSLKPMLPARPASLAAPVEVKNKGCETPSDLLLPGEYSV